MVNSGSFDATGSEGESVKAEFTQLEDGVVGACATEANFTAVVPETLLDLDIDEKPPVTKTSLQCSVPLDKVKNVLEVCVQKSKLNNYFILNKYIKQNKKSAEQQLTEGTEFASKPPTKRLLCLFCDRTFASNNLKQKHVDRCHSAGLIRRSSFRPSTQNQSATACCFCSKLNHSNHTLKQLLEHLINEHSNRYFACFACQERFSSAQALQEHNRLSHGVKDYVSNDDISSKSEVLQSNLTETCTSENAISASTVTNENSSLTAAKTLKRNSEVVVIENSGFKEDFEESIQTNIITQNEITESKSFISEDEDTKSKTDIKNKSKKNQLVNKKFGLKSTKNGVRTNIRTTRSSIKQSNNFTKNRKNKVKNSEVTTHVEKQSVCSPSSVFSLVNAFTFKYEKIYDHASDSIKDVNPIQFNAVFDKEFYLKTVNNIRDNLLHYLDGKLGGNVESESRISNFEHTLVPETETKPTTDDVDNFGCDLTLNAVTPVATLLGSSHYGEDFDAQIEYGAKASQKKPKKVAVMKYKFPNKKYNSLFREKDSHSDLTNLDMWTQLTVKKRQQNFSYNETMNFDAKQQVDELNSILDKRGPFEDLRLEANAAQFVEQRKKSGKEGDNISEEASQDVYFILENLLNKVCCFSENKNVVNRENNDFEADVKVEQSDDLELPTYLNLQKSPNNSKLKIDKTDSIALICSSQEEKEADDRKYLELSGEWTRPRIYICATCALKLPNLKALEDHKNSSHPHIWGSHYEFVGNQSHIYRHLSIPGLGKVGVVENLPVNRVWQRSDARVCTKCSKQCHNLGELHKHILECGGDWTWMLARKKCKYRPYGARSRRRRQRGYKRTCNPEREHKPKEKPVFFGPRPKPSKPSDAETIERMLANLPAKRTRKMISMRDGIQRPRKNKQNLNNQNTSQPLKPKKMHYKNKLPDNTSENSKNQKNYASQKELNTNLQLRSRVRKIDHQLEKEEKERIINKNKKSTDTSNKPKIRHKRMLNRILGSKIFDTSVIVSRRKLLKTITQNNFIRKTRLRPRFQQQDNEKSEEEIENSKDSVIKKSKIESNIKNSEIKATSNKRLMTLLTKSQKKTKVNVKDTVSAVIEEVVGQSLKEKNENVASNIRTTRRSLKNFKSNKNSVDIKNDHEVETSESTNSSKNNIAKVFSKKSANNFVKNVTSFGKSFRKLKPKVKRENDEGITSKFIRKMSIRRSKRKKIETEEKTNLNKLDEILEKKKTESCDKNTSENLINIDREMPVLEKIEPLPLNDTVNNSTNVVPTLEPIILNLETKRDSECEVSDNKAECDKLTSDCSNSVNKSKSKLKRTGKGLNDCIAMLKCKLEQQFSTDSSVTRKSDLCNNANVEDKNENVSDVLESNSNQISSSTDVKKLETNNFDILEVPTIKLPKTEVLISDVSTVETQTVEEDIPTTNSVSDYMPNIQLSYVLNATLTNCLMECVKNKCEKIKTENQFIPALKIGNYKIGSARKRRNRKSEIDKNVEKHIPNIPVVLNTAFIQQSTNKNSYLTKDSSDASDDDIPLTEKKRSSKLEDIPQINLQDKIEAVETDLEGFEQNIKDESEPEINSFIENIVNVEEEKEIENNIALTTSTVNLEEENDEKNKIEATDSKNNKELNDNTNLLPMSQQIMSVEDEPCENYLVNKTLTEANIEALTSVKNTFQNFEKDDIDSGKENAEDKSYSSANKKNRKVKIHKKTKSKRKIRTKNKITLLETELNDNKNILPISVTDEKIDSVVTEKINNEYSTITFEQHLKTCVENEPNSIIMETKDIQNEELDNNISSDSEDELPLALLIKKNRINNEIIFNIDKESTNINLENNFNNITSETDFVKNKSDILDITINKLENDLIKVDENIKIDIKIDDNIFKTDYERKEDILPEEINDEIKEDNNLELTNICVDNKIEMDDINQMKLNNIEEDLLKTPEISKCFDFSETNEDNNEESFITTPDLADKSLVIKIKTNFKIKIGKPKKSRRRVIPKELSRYNLKKKEEEYIQTAVFCEICNKTFKRKENLACHKKTLTHIAKLSEIEAKENMAKQMIEEQRNSVEEVDENDENILNKNNNEEVKLKFDINKFDEVLEKNEISKSLENNNQDDDELIKNEIIGTDNQDLINTNLLVNDKSEEIEEYSSDSERLITNEEYNLHNDDKLILPLTEFKDEENKSTENDILPVLINKPNGNLKLVDIISEVLEKPTNDLNIVATEYISQSPNSSNEPKRYKSLGERKSFDSDYKNNDEDSYNPLGSLTNGLLSKQLSLLENIIEETTPPLDYMDDSMSLSSHIDEPLIEENISEKNLFDDHLNNSQMKSLNNFSNIPDLIAPSNHFNSFENISDSLMKPEVQFDKNLELTFNEKSDNDIAKRKILNRDEELFLECCSLLKSGPEITSLSRKSTKNIPLNNFSKSSDASWINHKQSDQFIHRDSYSWLAQSSRVDTPIGEPFVSNDWSNSNSAMTSEWLRQKTSESDTIDKKLNSAETSVSEIPFEDISIDNSLEASKTLMAFDNSNNQDIPLDFHHVDFSNKNFLEPESILEQNENSLIINEDIVEESELVVNNEDVDLNLKNKVATAFGGIMAKALNNHLQDVVRKSKKIKGKRNYNTTQSSIKDYIVPLKKNKLNSTDSDSSDNPKKFITKGAMKVFEGIKVSIPTQDLNLKEVLNCSPKIKNGQFEEEPMKNGEIKENSVFKFTDKYSDKKDGKLKTLFRQFGNKLGLRERKKKHKSRSKSKVRSNNTKSYDVYEFEESYEFNNDKFSIFKNNHDIFDKSDEMVNGDKTISNKEDNTKQNHENDKHSMKWNMESDSDTDRYYDSMSFEEMSLSSESNQGFLNKSKIVPKKNSEKTKENQKKCMIMGRIFKNASKPKLEDKIPEIRDLSSEENSKIIENYLDSCSSIDNVENLNNSIELTTLPSNNLTIVNSANKMSKFEMDLLFDKLLEEEKKPTEDGSIQINNVPAIEVNNSINSSSHEITSSEKKKSKESKHSKHKKRRHNSENSSTSDEFTFGGRHKSSKKHHHKSHRKSSKSSKNSAFNLELEMKECIGVAGRKSQRKCTSGKQNVLIEFWSSDESSFEEVIKTLTDEKKSNDLVKENNKIEENCIEQKTTNDNSSISHEILMEKDTESVSKNDLHIYDFDSDIEKNDITEEMNFKSKEDFVVENKMKTSKKTAKQKSKIKRHSKSHGEESEDTEYEANKSRKRNEHKRKKPKENGNLSEAECLAVTRKKRNATEQLYYWSSSSDDEFNDLIEVKPIREDTDEDRPMQHGWIVGDSPKKLVTMLAQAKGKKIDGDSVKEQGKKNRVTL